MHITARTYSHLLLLLVTAYLAPFKSRDPWRFGTSPFFASDKTFFHPCVLPPRIALFPLAAFSFPASLAPPQLAKSYTFFFSLRYTGAIPSRMAPGLNFLQVSSMRTGALVVSPGLWLLCACSFVAPLVHPLGTSYVHCVLPCARPHQLCAPLNSCVRCAHHHERLFFAKPCLT